MSRITQKTLIVTSECMYDENNEVAKLPFRKDRPSEWTTIADNCQKKAAPVCMYILFTNACIRKLARHIHINVCMYVRTVCI